MSTGLESPICFNKTNQNKLTQKDLFTASTVIRINSEIKENHQKLNKKNDQVILTIPAQGWSIYNAQDQSILSCQKLPPTLKFKSSCFSFSIPNHLIQSSKQPHPNSRTRFIYAPIESCSSDPSPIVNQSRTIWLWIENEVNRGFGERIDPKLQNNENNENHQSHNTNLVNLIKSYSDPIQSVNPIHQTEPKIARILILLKSGILHLSDENLTSLKTCSILNPNSISPSIPNLNENNVYSIQLIQSNPLNQSLDQIEPIIYLTNLKPEFHSNSNTLSSSNLTSESNKSTNKRKLNQNQIDQSTNQLSHYSHLEIYLIKFNNSNNELIPLGKLTETRDFLDITINPKGWITFLEINHILSTFHLSINLNSNPQNQSFDQFNLMPHLEFAPIKLSTLNHHQDKSKSVPSSSLVPSLVTLPSSLPLVFLFTSHPNQTNTCLGLVLDLYHQAVLHVLEFPWPTPSKNFQSASLDLQPRLISTSFSTSNPSDHIFMCLSYSSLYVLQVLHPPQFSIHKPPTWVDILDPNVKQATLDWVISNSDSHIQSVSSKTIRLSDSISSSNLFTFSSTSSTLKNKKMETIQSQDPRSTCIIDLKLFIARFNQIWIDGPQNSTHELWNDVTSKAAELAWLECIINPMTNGLIKIAQNGSKKKKSKQLTQRTEENMNDMVNSLHITLGSVLPKRFVGVLFSMCLGGFAQSEESGQDEDETRVNLVETEGERQMEGVEQSKKMILQKTYPVEIVKSLLKTGLVDDKMIRGSVIRALRKTQDISMVRLGIAKLTDIREHELIKTIHWLIQLQTQAKDTISNESSSNESSNQQLQYFLAKIISQSLDPIKLRKSTKVLLTTLDSISIMKILLTWIEWWFTFGESSIGMTIEKLDQDGNGKQAQDIGILIKKNEIPNLSKIYEFLEIILDSKLIELIKSNHNLNNKSKKDLGSEVFRVLKSIRDKLSMKVEEDLILESLNGSLNQFNKLVKYQKSRQGIQKSSSTSNFKRNCSKNVEFNNSKNNVWSNKANQTKGQPKSLNGQINHSSSMAKNNHVQNKSKNKAKSTVKISNLASSNLHHFVDYSVEKFSL